MISLIKKLIKYLFEQILIPNIVSGAIIAIPSAIVSITYLAQMVKESLCVEGIQSTTMVTVIVCTTICLISIIFSIVSLFFYCNKFSKKNQPQFPKLETNYKIISSEFELFFQDRQHIIQRQKITFEVISEYLESIPHTMQWTGDMYANSSLDASSKKKGYELEITEKHTSYCNINIKFPEKKESGFSDTYSFETEVVDSKNKMRPVLARFIKCQTDYLCLKVTVPEGIIKECHSYVSADVPGDLKLSDVKEIIPEKVGQYWCYRFEKKDLELLRYYFLEWKFMNEI